MLAGTRSSGSIKGATYGTAFHVRGDGWLHAFKLPVNRNATMNEQQVAELALTVMAVGQALADRGTCPD